jgi:chitin disaccharide deacetylase
MNQNVLCRLRIGNLALPVQAAKVFVPLAAIIVAAMSARQSTADTWADRLGFPAGAKVILLHGNELGMCYESNAAGAGLLESKALRSASVMVPSPWFANFAEWRAAHTDVDLGLEFTLNSEWEHYRWKPVAAAPDVPSLIDADGYLWRTPIQTMVNASAAEVELELAAQINRAKAAGLRPSHFTTHLGALVTRPDLIEVYLRVARQHWIPAVVVELTPEQVERFRRDGFPLPDEIIQLMGEYPLPKVDDLRLVPDGETYEQKKADFLKMLRDLRAGITQIAISPAEASAALRHITPDWQQRVWDAQLIADADVQKELHAEGYFLTDWRDMMARFEGRPSQVEKRPTAPTQGAQR